MTRRSSPDARALLPLLLACVGTATSVTPCPNNASVDLDTLLAETLLPWNEHQTAGGGDGLGYGFCPEFYEGDIFLDGVEPWAEPDDTWRLQTPDVVNLWPGGVVHYVADVRNPVVVIGLQLALHHIQTSTATAGRRCIQFVPWSPGASDDFLFITDTMSADNCGFSAVGRRGGNQTLNIGIKTSTIGNIKHLLLHALGFWHENNRPSRDESVKVLTQNVVDGHMCYFNKYRDEPGFAEALPYDFHSVTHLALNMWSKDRYSLQTMQPHGIVNTTGIGKEAMLSDLDIKRIQIRYNCSVPSTTTPAHPTTQSPTSIQPLSTTHLPTTTQTPTTTPTSTTIQPVTTTQQPTTTLPPSTTQLPTTSLPPKTVCKDHKDGELLTYPLDCHKFYKCANHRDYLCCCSYQLIFSEEPQACGYPYQYNCSTDGCPTNCPNELIDDDHNCHY